MRSIVNLQILRGIAAASVVYYHIDPTRNFGSFGVDIFFVLSGFVMAMLLEKEPSPRDFAVARLCRILPLYWLMTIALFVMARWIPGLLNSANANFEQLGKSLFFVPFFRDNGDMFPLLGVGWTLNYEMLFYGCLFASLLCLKVHRMPAAVLLLLGMYVVLGYFVEDRLLNRFFGSNLIWEFVFGIAAWQLFRGGALTKVPRWLNLVVALFSYLTMAAFESRGVTEIRAVIFGLPSVLLLLAAVQLERDSKSTISVVRAWSAYIGDASYATYLSHYFVVMGMERVFSIKLGLFNTRSPVGTVLVFATALLVGQLLYVFADRPLHNFFKKKFV